MNIFLTFALLPQLSHILETWTKKSQGFLTRGKGLKNVADLGISVIVQHTGHLPCMQLTQVQPPASLRVPQALQE